MSARAVFDVVVAGRGVVGAVTALGLAQRGWSVAWVGPAPAPIDPTWDPDAPVVALSPASQGLLQALRVWDALPPERVAPVYDMRVFAGAHAQAPELHLDAYAGCVPALAWIVDVPALMRPLMEALRFAGVSHFDDRVVGLAQHDGAGMGHAEVHLQQGTALQARWVVAADGADSTLRDLAGLSVQSRLYPQRALVASWQCALPHADTAWQWMDDALGILALLPLPGGHAPGGRVSMVWSAPWALADELAALSGAALAERVEQATGGALGALTPLGGVRSVPLRWLQVSRLISRRLVLVGDAAHAMHPLAGQGLNVGLGDVACMLAVLDARESYRDVADPLLWRRYERARRAAVMRMQTMTDMLQRAFGPWPRPWGWVRDWGWRRVAGSERLRRQLIAQAVRF